jgi:hypothetical protein
MKQEDTKQIVWNLDARLEEEEQEKKKIKAKPPPQDEDGDVERCRGVRIEESFRGGQGKPTISWGVGGAAGNGGVSGIELGGEGSFKSKKGGQETAPKAASLKVFEKDLRTPDPFNGQITDAETEMALLSILIPRGGNVSFLPASKQTSHLMTQAQKDTHIYEDAIQLYHQAERQYLVKSQVSQNVPLYCKQNGELDDEVLVLLNLSHKLRSRARNGQKSRGNC